MRIRDFKNIRRSRSYDALGTRMDKQEAKKQLTQKLSEYGRLGVSRMVGIRLRASKKFSVAWRPSAAVSDVLVAAR